MLICKILMQGQMEVAVPVLPFPLQGLGNAYISLLRLAWISCQRVREGMQMRKRVLLQNTHIRNIPQAWQRAQRPLEALTRQGEGWYLSIWHQHTPALTAHPQDLSFCPQEVSTAGPQMEGLGLQNCTFFPSSLGTATLWALHTWMSRSSSSQPRPFMFPSLPQGWFLLTWLSSQALVVLYKTLIFWTDISKPITEYSCIK